MSDWKEGDQLPPSSIEFIVGDKKRKLTDDEKSRRFWLSVIGCLDTIMFFGIGVFINSVTKVLIRISPATTNTAPWIMLIILVGLLIFVNNCCMKELDRRFPRTRRDEQ